MCTVLERKTEYFIRLHHYNRRVSKITRWVKYYKNKLNAGVGPEITAEVCSDVKVRTVLTCAELHPDKKGSVGLKVIKSLCCRIDLIVIFAARKSR
jgi:hypothetical protein